MSNEKPQESEWQLRKCPICGGTGQCRLHDLKTTDASKVIEQLETENKALQSDVAFYQKGYRYQMEQVDKLTEELKADLAQSEAENKALKERLCVVENANKNANELIGNQASELQEIIFKLKADLAQSEAGAAELKAAVNHFFFTNLTSRLNKAMECNVGKTILEELTQARARIVEYEGTLRHLSTLGGGNSDGNYIAQKALSATPAIAEYKTARASVDMVSNITDDSVNKTIEKAKSDGELKPQEGREHVPSFATSKTVSEKCVLNVTVGEGKYTVRQNPDGGIDDCVERDPTALSKISDVRKTNATWRSSPIHY